MAPSMDNVENPVGDGFKAAAILDCRHVDIAGSEGGFAEMKSPAVTDDDDEAFSLSRELKPLIPDNSAQNPPKKGI